MCQWWNTERYGFFPSANLPSRKEITSYRDDIRP